MFDQLFDLPSHPLLIHAPIVLLPIAAIATVVLAVKPRWRERAGWFPLAGVVVVTVLLFFAKESGESFTEAFDSAFGAGAIDIGEHERLGNMTFVLTLVWLVALLALTVWEFVQRRGRVAADAGTSTAVADNPYITYVLCAFASVFAVLATVWLIRTGHEGADVVWSPLVPQLYPAG
jgi:preprotein translocase subunit SecG